MEFEYKIITKSFGQLTNEQFFAFCQENRNLRFERTQEGDIIIMPPTGGETGYTNSNIVTELTLWNRKYKKGLAFDSSTGFNLPNGAMRSPDAAWIKLERWQTLSPEEKKKFPPLCPDFVIELRSGTDTVKTLQAKMKEWVSNGCHLAWLLDVKEEKAYIYRPDREIEIISSFDESLSGEDVLPGFVLNLQIIQ